MNWRALDPAVPRKWLLAVAGLLWCGVGIMLCLQSVAWMRSLRLAYELPLAGAGLIVGGLAHLTLFSRIARKNIERIRRYPPRACLFGFQQWKGYLIVVVMIALGIGLRHSPIPRSTLAPAYLAVGTALLLSGLLVASRFFSEPRD